MRNEQRYIEKCLLSILAQDYPATKVEILVMDGRSSDDSVRIAINTLRDRSKSEVIDNPGITQSEGWNLGITRCTGDIIGIVSAHTELEHDYVSAAVQTLKRTGADMVGGPMVAVATGFVGKSIALASSTPFGVGNARFHYTDKEEEVDTVYQGLVPKELYEEIGNFDTEMIRNQDDELSYRILDNGGRIICNPNIQSYYHSRSTLRLLAKQYIHYGFMKVRVIQKHPRQFRIRHLVPGTMIGSLLCGAFVSTVHWTGLFMLTAILLSYFGCSLGASIWTVRHRKLKFLPIIFITYTVLHFSYGTGFLFGIIRYATSYNRR